MTTREPRTPDVLYERFLLGMFVPVFLLGLAVGMMISWALLT